MEVLPQDFEREDKDIGNGSTPVAPSDTPRGRGIAPAHAEEAGGHRRSSMAHAFRGVSRNHSGPMIPSRLSRRAILKKGGPRRQ